MYIQNECITFINHDFVFLLDFRFRMWNEVKKKAKVNLIWIYVQLAITQIMILQPGQLITFDMVDTDYLELPPPELILNTWKCVNDLYFELEFL